MFRDESQVLSSKRQRLAGTKKARHTISLSPPKETHSSLVHISSEVSTPQFSNKHPSPASFLTLNLDSSAEEQATCFFWRNYILEEHRFHNGNFQYLSDLYTREDIGESLTETVACLGLVGLSNFWKASNIMRAAQAKYNSALRLVSSRLRNVEEAKADQTLVAVMLLGLYEVICLPLFWVICVNFYPQTNTCSSPQSMQSWTKHTTGAAALLNLRGKQQLETSIGHHLFVHLRTQVVSIYWSRVLAPQLTLVDNKLHSKTCNSPSKYQRVVTSGTRIRNGRRSNVNLFIRNCDKVLQHSCVNELVS
jgi:hypothetical protein